MIGIQALQNTYQKATTKGLNYVNEYWKEERKDETGELGRIQKNQKTT